MSKYRAPSENSQYYIPKEDYLTAIHYSLRYPLWKEEADDLANTIKSTTYDSERVQSSGNYDATSETAIRIADSYPRLKMQMIDDLISICADGLDYWLRLGVCYGLTFEQLKSKGMPCEHKKYYSMRRRYYYELSLKI